MIPLSSQQAYPSSPHTFRDDANIRTAPMSLACAHTQGQRSRLWCSLLLEASISIAWKIIYQKQK